MSTNKHDLLLNRTFQYLGIILVMAAMGGGYWYWKNAQAGMEINDQTGKGLSIYFPLDEGAGLTTANIERAGTTGALNLSPTWANGKLGKSLSFSGGSYMDYNCSSGGCPTSYPFTVSFWFNASSKSGLLWGLYNTGLGQQAVAFSTSYLHLSSSGTHRGIPMTYINTGTWHHLTVIYRSATDMTGYLDGVDRTQASDDWWGFSCSGHMMIGARIGACNGNLNSSSKIDDVRIYNKALSVSEIQEIYNVATKNTGAHLQRDLGDSLEQGLVGYWKLDDASGTSAADSSGNGNTGTLTNGPTWTTGQIAGATNFDGTDDYVSIPDSSSVSVTSRISVSAWVNNSQTQTNTYGGAVIKKRNSATDSYQLLVVNSSGNKAKFTIDTTSPVDCIGTTTMSNGVWYHLMGTWDGATIRVYVNGALEASCSQSGSMFDTGDVVGIGGHTESGHALFGSIDEVRIYNRALSADDVTKLYRQTAPDNPDTGLVGYWPFDGKDISGTTAYDRSGKGGNGTLTNSPTKSVGKVGQAMSFNGTNSDVIVTDSTAISPTAALSYSFWAKRTDASGNRAFFTKSDGGGGRRSTALTSLSTGAISFFTPSGSNSAGPHSSTGASVTRLNEWSHIVAVFDGAGSTDADRAKIYVDGIQQTLTFSGTIPATVPDVATNLLIGGSGDAGDYGSFFLGSIDEFRMYNRALSASEIWSLYQAGAADKMNSADSQSDPLERGLAGYWKFDDGTGTSAADASSNGMTGTLTNGPTWTTGQVDGAVDLDGTNDYVSIADNSALDIGTGDFTYGFWLNPDDTTQGVFFSDGSYSDGIMFYRWTDTHNYVWLGNTYFSSTNWVPTASTWQHITLRRKSGTVTMYADGVQKFSGTLSNSINSSLGMRIGYGFAGAANVPVNGRIDEFRMYNRALSDEEILQLSRLGRPDNPDTGLVGYWSFNGPDIVGTTAYDRSGKGNNGTLTNGPTKTIGKSGQGMSFDGTDDYADLGTGSALANLGPVTISAWQYIDPTTNTYETIVDKTDIGAVQYLGLTSVWTAPSGRLEFRAGFNSANLLRSTNGGVLTTGKWQHIVTAWDGSTSASNVHIYVDGAEASYFSTVDGSGARTNDSSVNLTVGAQQHYGTVKLLKGKFDEVRIYNRALSAAEVTALYNAGR